MTYTINTSASSAMDWFVCSLLVQEFWDTDAIYSSTISTVICYEVITLSDFNGTISVFFVLILTSGQGCARIGLLRELDFSLAHECSIESVTLWVGFHYLLLGYQTNECVTKDKTRGLWSVAQYAIHYPSLRLAKLLPRITLDRPQRVLYSHRT